MLWILYNNKTRFSAQKISLSKKDFLIGFSVSENWLKLGPVQTQNLMKNTKLSTTRATKKLLKGTNYLSTYFFFKKNELGS